MDSLLHRRPSLHKIRDAYKSSIMTEILAIDIRWFGCLENKFGSVWIVISGPVGNLIRSSSRCRDRDGGLHPFMSGAMARWLLILGPFYLRYHRATLSLSPRAGSLLCVFLGFLFIPHSF